MTVAEYKDTSGPLEITSKRVACKLCGEEFKMNACDIRLHLYEKHKLTLEKYYRIYIFGKENANEGPKKSRKRPRAEDSLTFVEVGAKVVDQDPLSTEQVQIKQEVMDEDEPLQLEPPQQPESIGVEEEYICDHCPEPTKFQTQFLYQLHQHKVHDIE